MVGTAHERLCPPYEPVAPYRLPNSFSISLSFNST